MKMPQLKEGVHGTAEFQLFKHAVEDFGQVIATILKGRPIHQDLMLPLVVCAAEFLFFPLLSHCGIILLNVDSEAYLLRHWESGVSTFG